MKLSGGIRSQLGFFFFTILTFRIQFMNAANVSVDKITVLPADRAVTLCAGVTPWQQGKKPEREF